MKMHRLIAGVLAAALATPLPTTASINTASIASSSASTDCLDYKIVGTCFWLFCTYWGCNVRTSTKVKHFLPEMVISAYNHDGQNPWSEVSSFNKGIKGGEYRSPHKQYSQFTFKNADAVGHPQGAISQLLNNTGYYCKSQTMIFVPYFLSGLDAFAWKENLPEMFYPEAFTPGMREVGQSGDNWGNIYPRSGAINQVHDYKASAVIAQRVADVVTRMGQPHIYIPVAQRGGAGHWPPEEPVKEGNARTHKWQMLHPEMSKSCAVFPNGGVSDTYSSQVSTTGDYAWALWRPYKCCKRRGQTFLYSIDWQQ